MAFKDRCMRDLAWPEISAATSRASRTLIPRLSRNPRTRFRTVTAAITRNHQPWCCILRASTCRGKSWSIQRRHSTNCFHIQAITLAVIITHLCSRPRPSKIQHANKDKVDEKNATKGEKKLCRIESKNGST